MQIKLFCLGYAGASASFYNVWKKHLADFIDLRPVDLPGRGSRINEPFVTTMKQAVDDVYNTISGDLYEPYSIFGYSLGSWLTSELCSKIKLNGLKEPDHIFFAAKEPPHFKTKVDDYHKLPKEQFVNEIINNGGTPKELLEDEDFIDYLLPTMRADYEILDNFIHKKNNSKFNSNITVLTGISDNIIDNENIDEWKNYTQGSYELVNYKDGHFFIHNYTKHITNLINQTLLKYSNESVYK